METTDFTDDTDERRLSGGGIIPPFGRVQSNLPFFISFFIGGISVIRGRSPLFWLRLSEARPRSALCGFSGLLKSV
jgi:hypothetical protein